MAFRHLTRHTKPFLLLERMTQFLIGHRWSGFFKPRIRPRATVLSVLPNRQTSIPEASLRATDDTQRRIEAFFESNDFYYDRRKNYYRNNGKPMDRIIGIPLLAQTIMAVGLSRPDDSRARPSSLLKSDKNYQTMFSSDIPLHIYLWAAKAQKEVDGFLQTAEAGASTSERTNLRFHLAMLATAKLLCTRVGSPKQLTETCQ